MSNERVDWPVTGRTRLRINERSELVLQVQYMKRTVAPEGPSFDVVELWWRDAIISDIPMLNTIVAQAPPSVVINNSGAPIEDSELGIPGARKPN